MTDNYQVTFKILFVMQTSGIFPQTVRQIIPPQDMSTGKVMIASLASSIYQRIIQKHGNSIIDTDGLITFQSLTPHLLSLAPLSGGSEKFIVNKNHLGVL